MGFFIDGVSEPVSHAFMHDSITRHWRIFYAVLCVDEKISPDLTWSGGLRINASAHK